MICREAGSLAQGEQETGRLTNVVWRSRRGSVSSAPRLQGLFSTHVLLLVFLLFVIRLAAAHILLLFFLGRNWFIGEGHGHAESDGQERG